VSLNNFIPTIWSARILSNLHKQLVFGQPAVINRDYEGEIAAAGDTVRITSIGPVTVGNYSKNSDIGNPEVLDDSQAILTIDQQKYFNFQIDDVDKAQQNPKVMSEAMGEASYALANTADQFIAGLVTQVTETIGTDTAPVTPTTTAAYEILVDAGTMLDELNVPEMGRYVIVPPFYEGLMLKDDRFVAGFDNLQTASRVNGGIGTAAGFTVMKSNNVATTNGGSTYNIVAGTNISWSFANQLAEVEAYRPPTRFADALKGLHLYGAKVTRPDKMVVIKCAKPAGLA